MSERYTGPRFTFKDLPPQEVLRKRYLQEKPIVIKSGGGTWNIEFQDDDTHPIIWLTISLRAKKDIPPPIILGVDQTMTKLAAFVIDPFQGAIFPIGPVALVSTRRQLSTAKAG